MSSEWTSKVYGYLKEQGATSPPQIAKALGLETSTVMKALRDLKEQGKIELYLSSHEEYLERWKEKSREIEKIGQTWRQLRRIR